MSGCCYVLLFKRNLTHCLLGNFACFFFLSSADFSELTFSKSSFTNTITVSNSLDPDQARHFVGPDLGPNCCKGYQQMTLVGNELMSRSDELVI